MPDPASTAAAGRALLVDRGSREDTGDERQLLARARVGDASAVAALLQRHRTAAMAYATRLAGPSDCEDLVSSATVRILAQFAEGRGPTERFRPYLLTTIHSRFVDMIRSRGRETLFGDVATLREDVDGIDMSDGWTDRILLVEAFNSLPQSWQQALWYREVGDESHAKLAERLGSSPNAVAVLLFRAREGLRIAYLARHVRSHLGLCQRVAELPRYVRGTLTAAARSRLVPHVTGCASCQAALAELGQANAMLPVRRPSRSNGSPA